MSIESASGHDIIVVGASAGGVEALTRLVHGFPGDLGAAVFVVLHISPHGTSLLPQILSRNGPLPARHPVDGEVIQHGRIYLAAPDTHLLIDGEKICVSRGPRENGHRPAVDPLFRSAARYYGNRVVGVILSGTLDDGAAGLVAVKRCGGIAIVQDPNDALYPSMPRSAMEAVDVDHCLPISEIPVVLTRLANGQRTLLGGDLEAGNTPNDLQIEADIAAFNMGAIESDLRPGTPSGFGCPDCGGALWEAQEGDMIRFRCRVGHAWTANSLLAEQSNGVEAALWTALRALEERAALCIRVAERMAKRGSGNGADRFVEQAKDARQRAAILRQVLISGPTANAELGLIGPAEYKLEA